jgi:hypothetical protein
MIDMVENTHEAYSVSLPLKWGGWPPEPSEGGWVGILSGRKVLTPTRLTSLADVRLSAGRMERAV